MKDCWTILGILPTGDTAAIRKVYLELVKVYHPDTVLTPEKKREYTILCAEINRAYTQATEQAKTFSAPQPGARREATPPVEMYRDAPAVAKVFRQYTGMFVRRFGAAIMLLLFALQFLPYVSPSLLKKPPEALRIAVGAVATLFVVLFVFVIIFVYGVIIAGTMDLFLILLFPRKLMARLGLGRHEGKLVWLCIVIANVTLFFFTDLVRIPSSTDRMFSLYDGIFRALAAGTLPILLALNRLRESLSGTERSKRA
ncbi:MAG: J domain-containing protein [Blastocatellia bacterium]